MWDMHAEIERRLCVRPNMSPTSKCLYTQPPARVRSGHASTGLTVFTIYHAAGLDLGIQLHLARPFQPRQSYRGSKRLSKSLNAAKREWQAVSSAQCKC